MNSHAEKSATLAFLAHDLNNPLAAIRIYAEVLAADVTDPLSKQDVADILEATDHAAALVEALAAWARPTPPARSGTTFDLGELVREVCGRRTFRQRVQLELGAFSIEAVGDRDALKQALCDVCLNARRLTPEGAVFRVVVDASTVVVSAPAVALPDDLPAGLLTSDGAALLRARQVPVLAVGLTFARAAIEAQGWQFALALENGELVARIGVSQA